MPPRPPRTRTTARAITSPAAPASPCRNRTAMNHSADGTTMQMTEVSVNSAAPTSNGRRRPHASLSGPTTSWPSAMPTMIAVRVSWICASRAPRSAAIWGKAGR